MKYQFIANHRDPPLFQDSCRAVVEDAVANVDLLVTETQEWLCIPGPDLLSPPHQR